MSTYHNPFWANNFPDPFVLKTRGRYYAYATEETRAPAEGISVFPILTSTDLRHWQFVGRAMTALGFPYQRYWAPEVTFHNGQFFLYYAVHQGSDFIGGIRVAVAEQPEGPFIDSGYDLTERFLPWAIDPHVFRDQDGQWYLYMTIDYLHDPAGFVGSGNAVARLRDPFTLDGPITRVTPPAHQWQLFEKQRAEKGGVDWYTVEGPAVLKHRGLYYEMFSGGCYYGDNYAISYAISPTPLGPGGMQDTSWRDWAGSQGNNREAVLVRGDGHSLISPGHNSLVLGPDNTELYLIYHARRPGAAARLPCLDRLFWQGDELWTEAPTHLPQPAPRLPRLQDLFEQATLSPFWLPSTDTWRVADEAVLQDEETLESASLRANVLLESAWLLEVNARHEAGAGSYGLVLQGPTDRASLRVLLTSDERVILSLTPFPAQPLAQMRLPEQTNMQSWHQLLLELNGFLLCIYFDGLPIVNIPLPEPLCSFQSFALHTERCSAAFSGISLTDHFHDEFSRTDYTPALLGWQEFGPAAESTDWRIVDDGLSQLDKENEDHLLLKNLALKSFECGASMRLREQEARAWDGAAFGVTLWHNSQDYWQVHYVRNQSRWVLVLNHWKQSVYHPIVSIPLSTAFDPCHWHTLHLRCENNMLTIYTDSSQLRQIVFSEQNTRLGLHTHSAAATFVDVWQTGLVRREKSMPGEGAEK